MMTNEELINAYQKQSVEISELRSQVEELKKSVENFYIVHNDYMKMDNKENKNLSVIFKKYKNSILIKNMYPDKNTTIKCKNVLKELEAKWMKTEKEMGWIFVGKYKEGKSLEDNSNFIIKTLKEKGFDIEVIYEEE